MFVEAFAGSSGGGSLNIGYDYIKNIVDSNTHSYDLVPVVSSGTTRCTLNGGGVYVDSSNKLVYMYADFTSLVTVTPQSYTSLLNFSPTGTTILPCSSVSTNAPTKVLVTEETDGTAAFNLYIYSSSVQVGAGSKINSGERSKIWGIYSLNSIT